ncbi:MAG: DUF1800 family protein, partial [Chloroflexota bacterium]
MRFYSWPGINARAWVCFVLSAGVTLSIIFTFFSNHVTSVSASGASETGAGIAQESFQTATSPTPEAAAIQDNNSQPEEDTYLTFFTFIFVEAAVTTETEDLPFPATSTPYPEASPTPQITPTATPLPTQTPEPQPTSTPLPTATPSTRNAPNLALGQPVTSSSAVNSGNAGQAVDGETNGSFFSGSVFSTHVEEAPWWQVNLTNNESDAFTIYEISVYPRTDCCRDQLNDFFVFVSNSDMSGQTQQELLNDPYVWHTQSTDNDLLNRPKITLPVWQIGRYVKIQRTGSNQSLAMAEVEVIGEPLSDYQAVIQISQDSAESMASEASGEPVTFTVRRFGDLQDAIYPISILDTLANLTSAETDPRIAAVKAEIRQSTAAFAQDQDVMLIDGNGQQVTGAIHFAAGQDTNQLHVYPIADDAVEVPELLHIQIEGGRTAHVEYKSDVNVIITDREAGIFEDSRLLVGIFEPENRADTTAFGYATVRLSGDNSYAWISVSFSNLSGQQTSAHLHTANSGGTAGSTVLSLPLGQFTNEPWPIEASQHLITDQEMLDALMSGQLVINIHSENYPNGEIIARLSEQLGEDANFTDWEYPAPAYETLTAEELNQDIFRFLSQATFGATPELVADLEARIISHGGDRIAAYSEWIDEQILMDAPSHLEYYKAHRTSFLDGLNETELLSAIPDVDGRYQPIFGGWMTQAVYSKAQLRERIAFALSEIYVVAPNQDFRQTVIFDYNDTLKRGAFGPLENLLVDVARHPAMGLWLSSFQSQKMVTDSQGNVLVAPDENFPREFMQLFSIGLLEMHPNGMLKLGQNGQP